MEIVLTGKLFTGQEAEKWGLISRVVEETEVDGVKKDVVDEAVKVAGIIAGKGAVAVQSAKEGVNAGLLFFFRLA